MRMGKLNADKSALLLMYLLAGIGVFVSGYSTYIGTALFLVMVYLSMSSLFVYTLPLVFVLNDGLGTALLGHISFYWASLILVVWNRLYTRKGTTLSMKASAFLGGGIFYVAYLYFVQYSGAIREPIRTLVFFMLMTFVIEEIHQRRVDLWNVLLHIGLSCFIPVLHMAITGGVEFTEFGYEGSGGEWIMATRYGLLGAGTGDPNFSSMNILLGCVCVFYSKLKAIPKYGILSVMLFCLLKAVSVTSIVVLLGLISAGFLLEHSSIKKLKYICVVVLVGVVSFGILTTIPLGDVSEQIELWIYRIGFKLQQMNEGDISGVTTGRTDNVKANLIYAFDRNLVKILIGMDKTPALNIELSHNTYIDAVLRFGLFGTIYWFAIIVKKCIGIWKNQDRIDLRLRSNIITLKLLYAAYALTLSIYNGPEFVLMAWTVFVL